MGEGSVKGTVNWWDGYQERPDRNTVHVIEQKPIAGPTIILPNGQKLVPDKRPLGFDPKRTK